MIINAIKLFLSLMAFRRPIILIPVCVLASRAWQAKTRDALRAYIKS
jgi:hypothetical protein